MKNNKNYKVRIRLSSYDHRLVDAAAKKIVNTAKATGSEVSGPIPLPTQKEVFTILRSPHVNKDSREQFERRTHKRIIEFVNPKVETLAELQKMEITSGVDVEIKSKK